MAVANVVVIVFYMYELYLLADVLHDKLKTCPDRILLVI